MRLNSAMQQSSVFFVLFDRVAALDVVGPADVFTEANRASERSIYKLRYVSDQASVKASNDLTFSAEHFESAAPSRSDMIIIPGADEEPLRAAIANDQLRAWVKSAAYTASRVCSVCSGAFILADLGVIEGKRATTHWRGLDHLERWSKAPIVERDALFTEDGNFWTSAGVSSGIDMALAIVERDLGRPTALAIARELVLFLVRPGRQAQFSEPLNLQEKSAATDLHRLLHWLESRLTNPISVENMATAMGMSLRTLHRRCLAVFGQTPLSLLTTMRLDRARALLESKDIPLKTIAGQAGFSDSAAMRRVFSERFGVSPSEYRKSFS